MLCDMKSAINSFANDQPLAAKAKHDNIAISVHNLSKSFLIYQKPSDRLKQFLALQFQGISGRKAREYGRTFWALRDISFDIKKGETVAIIGKNGAGKSTLLQIICGTLGPTSGSSTTKGVITALLELGSGFNPLFTGRENIYLNGMIIGLSHAQIEQRFDDIVKFADIGDFIEQPVNTYSSGMYVRLAFAVQVCIDPDILVVDEALAVGDAYFVHRCFQRIREMKEQGKTILFVSHDTSSVVNLCDRAIWIDEGRLRMNGNPDDITRHYRANLFNIVKANQDINNQRKSLHVTNTRSKSSNQDLDERNIPNILDRLGDQKCQVLGLGIYDLETFKPVHDLKSGKPFLLRISLINNTLLPSTPVTLGYNLRSPKGEEIGAVNTQMENISLTAPLKGCTLTVRAEIVLPMLQPGSYALTIGLASQQNGIDTVHDKVINALVFQLTCDMQIFGLMRFPTHFSIETTSKG